MAPRRRSRPALRDAGADRRRTANGVLRLLRNALRSLEQGNSAAACSQLYDFQVEVTRKILDGALTAAEGVVLINSAATIRTALGC